MSIKELLCECEIILQNIEKYNSEPVYVEKFFSDFLKSTREVIKLIISDACQSFGIFLDKKHTIDKFRERAIMKDDQKALEFAKWYEQKFEEEQKFPNVKFIMDCIKLQEENNTIPLLRIFLKPRIMSKGDTCYPVNITSKNISTFKEELRKFQAHNTPVFLKIINNERSKNLQENITEKDIEVYVMTNLNGAYFDILECCRIYLNVLKECIEEATDKIKELKSFK